MNWGEIIKTALPVAVPAAAGMLNARASNKTEREQMVRSDAQMAEQNAIARDRLALDQQEAARKAQEEAIRQGLQSALMMNMRDASFDRSGFRTPVANISFSGGSRPSAIGEQGQQLAQLMNQRAMLELMKGSEAPKGTAVPKSATARTSATPEAEDKGGSIWQKALTGGTLAATLGPSIWGAMKGGSKGVAKGLVGDVAGGAMSGLNKFAGPAGMVAGIAAPFLPEGSARSAASGFSTGATIGSVVPGIGSAIGGGIGAAVGAIKGAQNDTLGRREDFAKSLGMGNGNELDPLFNALRAAGRDDLVDMAMNKIGKHDKKAEQMWEQEVASVLRG